MAIMRPSRGCPSRKAPTVWLPICSSSPRESLEGVVRHRSGQFVVAIKDATGEGSLRLEAESSTWEKVPEVTLALRMEIFRTGD